MPNKPSYYEQQRREAALQAAQADMLNNAQVNARYHSAVSLLLDRFRRNRRNAEVLAAFDFRVRQTRLADGAIDRGAMARYIAWTVYPLLCGDAWLVSTARDYGRSPLDVCADVCWQYVRLMQRDWDTDGSE